MAAKKVGTLIKEARTKAGLTQEQLARKISGLSASDLSKAERGEKELTTDQLKAIAKATGVTQKSLLEAPKGGTSSGSSTSSSGAKTSSGVKLTAAEKKLVELYRKADADTKAAVLKLLEGEDEEDNSLASTLLSSLTGGDNNALGNLLGNALGSLVGGNNKKES